MAPLSMSIKKPLLPGTMGANATRLIPLIRLTIMVAPTTSAPLLPADTKASPFPWATRRRPSAMEESFFSFMIAPA